MPDQTSSDDNYKPFSQLDMMTKLKYLIEALRGGDKGATTSTSTSRFPLEQQREGYRLHVQDAKANGETPMSYDDWLAQQPALGTPSQ